MGRWCGGRIDLCCGGCVLDGGLNCVGGKGGFP